MTVKCDLHTHSCFCDGKHSPREMVESAVEKGLEIYGVCAHSYVPFDEEYCLAKERYPEFQQEMKRLKETYSERLELRCGIEQDSCSETGTDGFDYVIGSVHYLKADDRYISVDLSAENFEDNCRNYFGGDYLAFCETYYAAVADVVKKTGCDIIGHFDLIAKFNEGDRYFSETDPRYLKAAFAAVDALIPSGIPFEINTGAISRGYRTDVYPAGPIRDYIRQKGGTFILSSDAHSRENIAFGFEKFE